MYIVEKHLVRWREISTGSSCSFVLFRSATRRSILIVRKWTVTNWFSRARLAHCDFTLENRPISGGFDACLSRGRFCACSRNFVGLVNQRTGRVQQRYKNLLFFCSSFGESEHNSLVFFFKCKILRFFAIELIVRCVLVVNSFFILLESWKKEILEQTASDII